MLLVITDFRLLYCVSKVSCWKTNVISVMVQELILRFVWSVRVTSLHLGCKITGYLSSAQPVIKNFKPSIGKSHGDLRYRILIVSVIKGSNVLMYHCCHLAITLCVYIIPIPVITGMNYGCNFQLYLVSSGKLNSRSLYLYSNNVRCVLLKMIKHTDLGNANCQE